jgi:transposase-like protein
LPKRSAREFRREICETLLAGERVSNGAHEIGVSQATLHRWKNQALIDAGLKEGVQSMTSSILNPQRIERLGAPGDRPKPLSASAHDE